MMSERERGEADGGRESRGRHFRVERERKDSRFARVKLPPDIKEDAEPANDREL